MVLRMANSYDQGFEYLLVHYRWIFVCFFLLPISVLYNVYFSVRNWIVFNYFNFPKWHEYRVRKVQREVQQWQVSSRNTPMCTGRPGWLTISFREGLYKKSMFKVDVNFSDILFVDLEQHVVCVEPQVTMGQITATLIPLGWTLPVLPELDDLTVGGLIMGTGIETSSHKYGLFQHTCVSFEIVIADGSVINCSKDEHSDLFYCIPWSHGTLGFLCSALLKIIPAKKYVKMNYHPVYSLKELVLTFIVESTKPNPADFVEGIMFTSESGVVMSADMVDKAENNKVNRVGCYYKPWFYKHVESFLKDGGSTEFIPLRDYYHRHSRSIFWQLQNIIPFGNNFFFRYLCGWMTPPKISLLKLTQGEATKKLYEEHQMIQDVLIPMNNLEDALNFMNENIQVFPLWLCPFVNKNQPGFICPSSNKDEMYVDIGIYGQPELQSYNVEKITRHVEEYVRSIKGFQMLYADTYMTREEFRQMFDHKLYDIMRNNLTDCQKGFPEVYDKINRKIRF